MSGSCACEDYKGEVVKTGDLVRMGRGVGALFDSVVKVTDEHIFLKPTECRGRKTFGTRRLTHRAFRLSLWGRHNGRIGKDG